MGEDVIVETDDFTATAPVLFQFGFLDVLRSEVAGNLFTQQMPVGSAPAVDGLLDVTHNEVGFPLGDAVGKEWLEVAPLQQAGILRLVQHQVVVAVADLFIDERRVVIVDDAAQQVG